MSHKSSPRAIVKIITTALLVGLLSLAAKNGGELEESSTKSAELSEIPPPIVFQDKKLETIKGLEEEPDIVQGSALNQEPDIVQGDNTVDEETIVIKDEEVEVMIARTNRVIPIASRSGQDIIAKRVEALKELESTLKDEPKEKDPLENATPLTVEVTAYCPGTPGSGCPTKNGHPYCTGPYADGRTATGIKAKAGSGTMEDPHIVAVDPKVIPLKTMIYIPGYGYARAEDVGGAIKGKRIDLLFDKHKDALKFGRQKIKILILKIE